MKNIFKILLVTAAGSILLIACKKYKDEFYGPALGIAPSDFSASALSVSNSNPNFISQTVFFKSTFNATVRWTLTLTGQTSGAIKKITGVSNALDASTAVWNGSTDTLKQFRKTETVEAKLTVLGWKDTLSTTLTVGGEKNRGNLLGTFENITVDQVAMNWQDATGLWWYFSFESGEKDTCDKIADPTTPNGMHALRIAGHDANTSYYIGQAGLSAPGGAGSVFNFGSPALNDFYFNVYVKGSGTAAANDYKFVIQAYEDDNGGGINYSGDEDKYTYTISLKYEGWKLFRIPYSSFALDSPTPANIYRSHSPNKIANIGMFFGANTSAGLSSTTKIAIDIDHFSITTDGPMIP